MGRLLQRHGSAEAVLALAGRPDGARSLVAASLPADEAAAVEPGSGPRWAGLDPGVAAGSFRPYETASACWTRSEISNST